VVRWRGCIAALAIAATATQSLAQTSTAVTVYDPADARVVNWQKAVVDQWAARNYQLPAIPAGGPTDAGYDAWVAKNRVPVVEATKASILNWQNAKSAAVYAGIGTGVVLAGTLTSIPWGAVIATTIAGIAVNYGIMWVAGKLGWGVRGTQATPNVVINGNVIVAPPLKAGQTGYGNGSTGCFSATVAATASCDNGVLAQRTAAEGHPHQYETTSIPSTAYPQAANTYDSREVGTTGPGTPVVLGTSTASKDCAGGILLNNVCQPAQPESTKAGSATDVATAAGQTPQSMRSSPIEAQTLADFLNSAWRGAASQPGYSGLPWDPYNPIKTSDVAGAEASKPGSTPNMGDMSKPSGGSFAQPSVTSTSPTTGYNPANPSPAGSDAVTVKVDLGPDPGVTPPTAEPPTNFMPELAKLAPSGLGAWQPATRSVACPTWPLRVPSMWPDRTWTIDAHCPIIEQNRSAISVSSKLGWLIAAVLAFMAA
jgi:hypothetical protein